MTQIDFYILTATTTEARLTLACRLVETILRQRYSVHLHVEDAAMAAQLDEMLWTFRRDSYLPHMRLDAPIEPPPPVTLGFGDHVPAPGINVLLNLGLAIPDWFSRFERVAEIICQHQTILTAKRECWKLYKQRGYPIKRHELSHAMP